MRVQAFRSGTRLALESPVSFRSQGYALMRVRGPALDPYPRKDSIATMILDNAVWRRDELEIGVAAQATYGLDLRLPTLRQVLERLLTTRGIEHSLSEKGALAVGLLRDSTTAELLLQPRVRVLVETLTTPRRAHLIRRLTQLVAEASVPDVAALIEGLGGRTDRRSRSFSDLRSLVRSLTLRTVEDLADRLWLERGLTITCQQCRIDSFVPLEAVGGPAVCPACGHPGAFRTDRHGIAISYRLDAIVDRASDQGLLPHLMLMARLAQEDPTALLLPGVDVRLADGTRGEIDVLGIHQQLLLAAEVKSSPGAYNRDEIVKDVARSQAIGADVHLMACLHRLNPGDIRVATEVASRAGIAIRFVDDLEPVA